MIRQIIELTKEIETLEFKLVANQASGLSAFKQIVSDQPVFQTLRQLVASDDQAAIQLVRRIHDLSTLETDVRYEHPHDTAIATYLLALDITGSRYAAMAAHLLSNTLRLWWSDKVSRQIISTAKSKSPSADGYYPIATEPYYLYPASQTHSVRDAISWRVLHQTRVYNYAIIPEVQPEPQTGSIKAHDTALVIFPLTYVQGHLFGKRHLLTFPATDQVGDVSPHWDLFIEMEQ